MKKVLGLLLLAVTTLVLADEAGMQKLWITKVDFGPERVLFIQDKETGTRCYAVTNSQISMSGYAISCVKGDK